jgi:transposase
MGLSGRAILQALCEGESDPKRLAKLVHPSVHASQEEIRAALTGEMREHHRFLLRELLSLITVQDCSITHLEEEIERHLHPFEEQITRCEKINGVSRHVLHVLMAEVGVVCRISIRFFLPITFRRTVQEPPVEQINTMRQRMSPAT